MFTITILLIPTILAFVLMALFAEKMCLWEYALLIGASLSVSIIGYCACSLYNESDTKFVSHYVTSATRYEAWNELELRSRTVGSGKHRHTVYYHENVEHPEEYHITLNNGDDVEVSRIGFNAVVGRLNTKAVFVDMHRDYNTRDGDAYRYRFDRKFDHIYPYVQPEAYDNPVQSSSSIFKYSDISAEEAKRKGLYDYPPIKDGRQRVILGKFPGSNPLPLYQLNAEFGQKKDFRLFLLFFENKGPEIAEYQKAYWKGGNQNELVLCIGYSKGRIQWCEGFSWCDRPVLEGYCKDYFLTHQSLDGAEFTKFMRPLIRKHWQAKSFDDFDYVVVELTAWQLTWILILTIIVDVALSVWLVTNEYDNV